jgi:hypothetical protein
MDEDSTSIESDEEHELFVVDPDDYQETKKLETIYRAKKHVHNVRENYDNVSTRSDKTHWESLLAKSIADYGSELLPLIEDALEEGLIDSEDVDFRNRGDGNASVVEFIIQDGGIVEDQERRRPTPAESMAAYRQIERIQRELGLGLDIEEDTGPAQI